MIRSDEIPMAPRRKRCAEEDDDEEAGNAPAHKLVVRAALSPQQDMYADVIVGPPPLGLQLRKSASFLDLVRTVLSKPKTAEGQPAMANIISEPSIKNDVKSGAIPSGERLKASKFRANFLKIGTWEYTSQYDGDLVAKCYYAKHKLVWEVLYSGLKSKIELEWSRIAALKATCPEDGDGILDLVLSQPPLFFQEMDPQPRKHRIWQAAADFTGGQASVHRRHILRCPSSLLSRNFEKLIRCDQRLNQLSQQQVSILHSPFFGTRSSILENPNESGCPSLKLTQLASPCVVSSVSENNGVNHLMLKQQEVFSLPMNLGSAASDIQANYVAQQQNSSNLCDLAVSGPRSSMSMDDLLNHLDNFMREQHAAGNPPLHNAEVPSKELLDISEILLSDTHGPPSADEKYLMARVDSFGSLLEKDTTPFTIPTPEHNGTIVAGEVGSPGGRTTYGGGPPIISRKDSFADLLENLPRVAFSELLFDIVEDSENNG